MVHRSRVVTTTGTGDLDLRVDQDPRVDLRVVICMAVQAPTAPVELVDQPLLTEPVDPRVRPQAVPANRTTRLSTTRLLALADIAAMAVTTATTAQYDICGLRQTCFATLMTHGDFCFHDCRKVIKDTEAAMARTAVRKGTARAQVDTLTLAIGQT